MEVNRGGSRGLLLTGSDTFKRLPAGVVDGARAAPSPLVSTSSRSQSRFAVAARGVQEWDGVETRNGRAGRTQGRRDPIAYSETIVGSRCGVALLSRAQRLEAMGDPMGARVTYRRVAELGEMAALALVECARVEREIGMLETAIFSLTEALHHCTSDVEQSQAIYVELGDVYAQRGDYEEASYHYRRAMVYDPDREDVQRRLRCASRLSYLGIFDQTG